MNLYSKHAPVGRTQSQSGAAAEQLYQAVRSRFGSRPLFFLQLDQLYLSLCDRGGGKDDFEAAVQTLWQRFFPQLPWTAELAGKLDNYQRACRKWVWLLLQGRELNAAQRQRMEALFRMYRALSFGQEQALLREDPEAARELRLYLGACPEGTQQLVQAVKQSDVCQTLERLCSGPETGPENGALSALQDTLMWMGVVALQPGEEEPGTDSVIRRVIRLWDDVMDQPADRDGVVQWARGFSDRLSKSRRLPSGLMRYPYSQIRDLSAKTRTKLQFALVYALACTQGESVTAREVAQGAAELLQGSFGQEGQLENILTPALRSVGVFCGAQNRDHIHPAAALWCQQRYEFVQSCYERLRKLNEDEVNTLEDELARRRSQAEEDLALMYQEREDQVLSQLMQLLSDPMYGNVIGRLYRMSEGELPADDPAEVRRLLKNLFLLLQQKHILPLRSNPEGYPQWTVRGRITGSGQEGEE